MSLLQTLLDDVTMKNDAYMEALANTSAADMQLAQATQASSNAHTADEAAKQARDASIDILVSTLEALKGGITPPPTEPTSADA